MTLPSLWSLCGVGSRGTGDCPAKVFGLIMEPAGNWNCLFQPIWTSNPKFHFPKSPVADNMTISGTEVLSHFSIWSSGKSKIAVVRFPSNDSKRVFQSSTACSRWSKASNSEASWRNIGGGKGYPWIGCKAIWAANDSGANSISGWDFDRRDRADRK